MNLGGGAETNRISKVPVNELEAWDANHDASGRLRNSAAAVRDIKDDKSASTPSEAESKKASIIQTTVLV